MWTERLVRWISSYDREYPSVIEPAKERDIEELQRLLGKDLPDVYLEFLRTMGQCDGGLFNTEGADTTIGSVLDYYEESRHEDPPLEFDNCVPFAVGDVFEGLGLHLGQDRQPPPVVFLEDGDPGDYVSKSLPAFCFQHAFLHERSAAGQIARYQGFDHDLDSARELLSEVGFVEEWFSDARLYCARRGKVLLTGFMGAPGRRLAITVGGLPRPDGLTTGGMICRLLGGRLERLIEAPTLPEMRAGNVLARFLYERGV